MPTGKSRVWRRSSSSIGTAVFAAGLLTGVPAAFVFRHAEEMRKTVPTLASLTLRVIVEKNAPAILMAFRLELSMPSTTPAELDDRLRERIHSLRSAYPKLLPGCITDAQVYAAYGDSLVAARARKEEIPREAAGNEEDDDYFWILDGLS